MFTRKIYTTTPSVTPFIPEYKKTSTYIKGFAEWEKNGLLAKIICYFNLEIYLTTLRDGRFILKQEEKDIFFRESNPIKFTTEELNLILSKIPEDDKISSCMPFFSLPFFSLPSMFRYQTIIDDSSLLKIFKYLDSWKRTYRSNSPAVDMRDFLCGFINQIRLRREALVQKVKELLVEKFPYEITYMIDGFLPFEDKILWGGKRTIKYKKKSKKTIKNLKKMRKRKINKF